MKKIFFLLLVAAISLQSCKSDDDEQLQENQYPKTVNIKYELTSTVATAGYIHEFINNENFNTNSYYDGVNLVYSHTVAQKVVNKGTYLKLRYRDSFGGDGQGEAPNYQITLKMYVNEKVVKEKTYTITSYGTEIFIDYTFN